MSGLGHGGAMTSQGLSSSYALQMHFPENLKQNIPRKETARPHSQFYIHVSVSDLYIPAIGPQTH